MALHPDNTSISYGGASCLGFEWVTLCDLGLRMSKVRCDCYTLTAGRLLNVLIDSLEVVGAIANTDKFLKDVKPWKFMISKVDQ